MGEESEIRVVPDGVTSTDDNEGVEDEFVKMLQELSDLDLDQQSKDDHKEREYQTFLINLAKQQNIIACLPTGSGKTFIALQLTKFYLPSAIKTKKKIIFLANTVPLVNQQAEYFRSVLSNTFLDKDAPLVECLTGDRNVDVWDIQKWTEIVDNCTVMVMTTQILDDMLNHDFIRWRKIMFLVLDECHHTDKDHAMHRVMTNYRNAKCNGELGLPKVLGLTATIINGKKVTVESEVQEAELRLDAIAVTYHKYAEVLKFSTSACIDYVKYPTKTVYEWSRRDGEILKSLKEFEQVLNQTNETFLFEKNVVKDLNHSSLTDSKQLFGRKPELKKLKSIVLEVLGVYTDLGPYCAKISALKKRAFLQVAASLTFENKYLTYFYLALDTALQTFVCKLDNLMSSHDVTDQVQFFISQKLRKLLDVLKAYGPTVNKNGGGNENGTLADEELCGIVFVQKRITAQCLAFYFQDIVDYKWKPYGFIRVDFVVGSSRFDLDQEKLRITTKKQNEVIQKFHTRKINLLIATNVIEEGLNVPACNIVVRFDKILTYPSFVQSMGRARKENSKFYAFVDEEEAVKQQSEYKKFEQYTKRLSDCLIEKALLADEDDEQCDEKTTRIFEQDQDFVFEPKGKGIAPRITALESISIANRYCQALPCDRLVTLAPLSWWVEVKNATSKKQFKAYVQFPSNSVIREVIEGKEQETKVLAKRSAFLEACKELYRLGVLDDRLFPKSQRMTATITKFLESVKIESDAKGRKVGSHKRLQRYLKKIPNYLKSAKISRGTPSKVYQIVLEQYIVKDDEISQSLYQFSKCNVAYGILTPVDLSLIPQFLLDVNPTIGCLKVSLKEIALNFVEKCILASDEIQKLEDFERYIIGDLLQLKRNVMRASNNTSILVIPLKTTTEGGENFQIYWELVKKVSKMGETFFRVPSPEIRREFSFNANDYNDSVLVPWYRGDIKLLHTVLSVSELTPLSTFPHQGPYPDYKSYFLGKYSSVIDFLNNNQCLVRAKSISKNLNFFTRKAAYQSSKEERKDQKDNIVELIPELCTMHPMPASLYIQAKFIPSIFHRMSRFLCAKEIQELVAKDSPWSTAAMDKSKDFEEEVRNLMHKYRTPPTENSCPEQEDKSTEKNVDTTIVSEVTKTEQCHCMATVSVKNPLTHNQNDNKKSSESTPVTTVALDNKEHLLLDFTNPNRITHNQLDQIRTINKQKKEEKKNQQIVGSNGFDWTHEKETKLELVDINSIQFESLDTQFNFEDQPSLYKIMEAITMQGSRDYLSLERLETMGDSFLKYCVSRHVFTHFPDANEGEMTKLRSELVSNAFLYQHGKRIKLGEYLAGGLFVPESAWIPLTFEIPGNLAVVAARHDLNEDVYLEENLTDLEKMTSEELDNFIIQKKQKVTQKMPQNAGYTYVRISDKSIADSIEALIGAYYTQSGPGGALHFMKTISFRAPTDGLGDPPVPLGTWGSPEIKLLNPEDDSVESHIPLYHELEELIGYTFKEPWLLMEAFMHPGYAASRVTQSYQRLEFLGDALLDFLITKHIYNENYGNLSPGELTDLRSALVNNVTFGSLTIRYGLHTYLLNNSKPLQDAIDLFANVQKSCNHKVTGHFKLLTDFDCPSVLVQDIDVPKVLGDIFESLAGAVYVDSGMSLDTVWRVFYRLMKNEIDLFSKSVPKSPVRELNELYPNRPHLFTDIQRDKENENTRLTYVVLTVPVGSAELKIVGAGRNKESAKLGAAKFAMRELKNVREG